MAAARAARVSASGNPMAVNDSTASGVTYGEAAGATGAAIAAATGATVATGAGAATGSAAILGYQRDGSFIYELRIQQLSFFIDCK